MSTIATKTGTANLADGRNARVVAEICDSQGTCCQTSSDGRGLDNSKVVRQAGQTDVYTDTAILGSCSQKVVYILTLGEEKLLGLDVLIYLCFDQLCFVLLTIGHFGKYININALFFLFLPGELSWCPKYSQINNKRPSRS